MVIKELEQSWGNVLHQGIEREKNGIIWCSVAYFDGIVN